MSANRLSGCQARAARAMLAWSVRELAERSGISESSIRRIESDFGVAESVTLDLLEKLKSFFEGRGFRFFLDGDGPGVQWKRRASGRRGSGSIDAAADGPDVLWVF